MIEPEILRHRIRNPYKSFRWIKLKTKIIQRYGSKCGRCGISQSEAQLSVHHKAYVFGNDICDYPECMLVPACKHCHSYMHSKRGIKEGWFTP